MSNVSIDNLKRCPDASDDALLSHLLALLSETGDDPIEGLAGYLVTEDPTYLPEHPEVKALIRSVGRDKLLRMILSHVLKTTPASEEV